MKVLLEFVNPSSRSIASVIREQRLGVRVASKSSRWKITVLFAPRPPGVEKVGYGHYRAPLGVPAGWRVEWLTTTDILHLETVLDSAGALYGI